MVSQLAVALALWAVAIFQVASAQLAIDADPLAADDECVGDAESCTLNALQLKARQQRAATMTQTKVLMERIASVVPGDPGLQLKSSFFVGSGVSPSVNCESVTAGPSAKVPRAALYSSFGAGGGGEVWSYSGLVIMDAPGKDEVGEGDSVYMTLTISAQEATFTLDPCSINVAAIGDVEDIPDNYTFQTKGSHGCPPDHCLIPEPAGPDLPKKIASPECGFAKTKGAVSVAGPTPGAEHQVVNVNITNLLKTGRTKFKIWASPTKLRNGLWQIPALYVTSWGFQWTTTKGSKRC